MTCHICPLSNSVMCGVKDCESCRECGKFDEFDKGKPSERDFGVGSDITLTGKAAHNGA